MNFTDYGWCKKIKIKNYLMRHQGQFPQETSVKCVNKTMNRLCAFSLLEEKPVTHTHTHRVKIQDCTFGKVHQKDKTAALT